MSGTQRVIDYLLDNTTGTLKDNTAGAISASDLRDAECRDAAAGRGPLHVPVVPGRLRQICPAVPAGGRPGGRRLVGKRSQL